MLENTKANVIGEIVSDFTLNRKVFGENFYTAKMSVKRLSGQTDIIPLVVPGRLVDINKDYKGRTMKEKRIICCCLFLYRKSTLWRSLSIIQRIIRFIWKVISVKSLSIVKLRLVVKLRIC